MPPGRDFHILSGLPSYHCTEDFFFLICCHIVACYDVNLFSFWFLLLFFCFFVIKLFLFMCPLLQTFKCGFSFPSGKRSGTLSW